ncbi:hypothetical protein JKP88DRAFT_347994 [Tribonema minus]|uniref:SWIM-type domain-containing protein n=1 Tax=Tribonema minus TaxID=303371 RepID=A0A836CIZ6_9STRA|nr:hypothetical protein JKP88DRAFT_347994 [Tribonema minus]
MVVPLLCRQGVTDNVTLLDDYLAEVAISEGGEAAPQKKEEILRMVTFLFQSTQADNCADVLDHSRIVECVGRQSRRRIWLVQSSSHKGGASPYVCLGGHYCSCRNFQEVSKKATSLVLCKHLLAIRLAQAFGKLCVNEVDDGQLYAYMRI